jgi:hypothetical protein
MWRTKAEGAEVCYGCLQLCYGQKEKVMSNFSKDFECFDSKTAISMNVSGHVTVEKAKIPNVYEACYGCYTLYTEGGSACAKCYGATRAACSAWAGEV